jgi:hypothetical protein
MFPPTSKSNHRFLTAFTLAVAVVLLLFFWQGNKGFSLWDEGFLWYGSQRVVLGEVPIRDFMAYDPGRYYWSAAIMSLVGDNGIMSLRAAVALFQSVGLLVALLLINHARRGQSLLYMALSAITLAAWMFPRHKLFDISLSIFLIGVLTLLILSPTKRRHFLVGLSVGLIAVFGRNHGFYGVIGSLGVIFWLNLKRNQDPGFIKGVTIWGIGVALGFTPVLFMAGMIPGFAEAFWESIRFLLFEAKATNLGLPTPWPWRINFSAMQTDAAIRGILIGLFFIGIAMFSALSLVWVIWQQLNRRILPPALVASSFMALPYVHYAFSRADIAHLAQGIFPFLIGCLILISTRTIKIKLTLVTILCAASLWVMSAFHPAARCISRECVEIEVSGNLLEVSSSTAKDVALLRTLAAEYAPNGENFIAAPFWPGAYPLLQRKSAMWEIYALWPRTKAFQLSEIERLIAAKPQFAVIINAPLNGREELRFQNTHPLIHGYVAAHFERIPASTNSDYQIYKAKTGTP